MSEPVLTSSWCTAWGSYNTPRLWAMVKDEDDPEAWRQVAAWGAISGAVKDQRSLLLKAREALVAAWPPEQNKSSEAFVREVDELIGRMDAARSEADDTSTGLANILEALRQAKNNIRPLWEQYKEKSDDLVPAWWDNAEDELDKQAQAHMSTAEQIVQDNVTRLRVPDPYALEPADPHFQPAPLTDDGGGSPGAAGVGGSAGGRAGGGVTVPVPHDPVPPLPGQEPTVPSGADSGGGPASAGAGVGSGPGLAGVINPPVTTPPPATSPPGGGAFPPGAFPPGGGGPGVVPPVVGPGVGGPGVGGTGPVGTGGSRRGGSGGSGGIGTDGAEPGLRGTGGGGTSGGGTGGLGAGGLGGVGRGARPGARPAASGRGALPSGAVIGETVAGEGRGSAGSAGRGGAGGAGAGAGGAGRGGAGVGGVGGAAGRGAGARGGTARDGAVRGGAASGGAARGASGRGAEPVRPPRPSWLPDEPVGAARTAGLPGVPGGARGGRGRGAGEQWTFDPDNPWEVAAGVEPVIEPGQNTARHDPGPNVIGRHE